MFVVGLFVWNCDIQKYTVNVEC